MIFTNAHTPSPACAPARAAILTGVHHARTGMDNVYWGDGPKWRDFEGLEDVATLEQSFKQHGYLTLGAGKIYHSQAPPWQASSQIEPANWDFGNHMIHEKCLRNISICIHLKTLYCRIIKRMIFWTQWIMAGSGYIAG